MGVRFRKSVSLGKGARVNLTARGASLSLGPRGNTISFGKTGTYSNIGLPGTGLSYRTKLNNSGTQKTSSTSRSKSTPKPLGRFDIGMDAYGNLTFFDQYGNQITDETTISQIKRSPQFQEIKGSLQTQHSALVANAVQEQNAENEALLTTHLLSLGAQSSGLPIHS